MNEFDKVRTEFTESLIGKECNGSICIDAYTSYLSRQTYLLLKCPCGYKYEAFIRRQDVSCPACNIDDLVGCSTMPEYRIWYGMLNRCYDSKNQQYHRYGGRGIIVCEQWHEFRCFFKDMGPRPKDRMSLDRINNDGNYEKANCRWATYLEQGNNTSKTIKITIDGETKSVTGWARHNGISAAKMRAQFVDQGLL